MKTSKQGSAHKKGSAVPSGGVANAAVKKETASATATEPNLVTEEVALLFYVVEFMKFSDIFIGCTSSHFYGK